MVRWALLLIIGVALLSSFAAAVPSTVYFHSDWSTSLGTGTAAVSDTDKDRPWTYREGFALDNSDSCPSFEVMSTAADGRDFPTDNFMRMRGFNSCPGAGSTEAWSQLGFLSGTNYVPNLADGDSVFIRYYIRNVYPYFNLWNGFHGDEWVNAYSPYSVQYNVNANNWQVGFIMNDGTYCNGGNSLTLDKNEVYRVEHGITREGGRFTVQARIYDSNDNLVADSSDFNRGCWDGQTGQTLANNDWSGGSGIWNRDARQFHIGMSGIAGLNNNNDGQTLFEWAGFAVCDDWCGAYPIPGVEASSTGPGPVPQDLVFASSWSTATGSGDAAIMDQGRDRPWRYTWTTNNNLVVVPSNGLFPSTNHIEFNGYSGNIYVNGFEDEYWSDVGENQYITVRFLFIPEGNTFTPAIYNAAIGANFWPGGSLNQNQLYELQLSVQRRTGTTFEVDAVIFADPMGARAPVYTTSDWATAGTNINLDTLFSGNQRNINMLRDFNVGFTEGSFAAGEQSHPFELLTVNSGSGYSFGGDSAANWHFSHSGTTGSEYGSMCCVSIAKGQTTNREWPMPAWTQAEEQWTPGATTCSDGQTRSCGSTDVGVCSYGTQTCSAGSWGACVGNVEPTTEICDDSLDNDCDGQTDCQDGQCSTDSACQVQAVCPDGVCNGGETCSSCAADCGACGTNTVIDFDSPAIGSGGGAPLNGVFGGMDFGNGLWAWTGPYASSTTNSIYFASSSGTSRAFSFTTPQILTAMTVYTDSAGTLTLTDDAGQSVSQAISNTGLEVVSTGWTNAASTVTVDFTQGWSLGIDDITYRAAAACTVTPNACDSVDNDCDGSVDEADECTPPVCSDGAVESCGTNVGVCSEGSRFCSNEQWSACIGGVQPITEVCNDGLDNDCDGQVDEGCFAGIPGDYNLDGIIDFRDLVNILSKLGRTGMQGDAADADNDGDVDLFDLVLVSRSWQRPEAASIVVQQIPDQLRVQIDAVCPAESGRCQVRRVSPSSLILADGPDNAPQVFDDAVVAGTQYTYNVRYWDAAWGAESLHSEASVTVQDSTPVCTPTPNACDGVDNDCDGQIDETNECALPSTILLQEDFEDSNFASRGWYDFFGGPWTHTTAEAFSGSGSLEMRYNQGSLNPDGGTARHLFNESDSLYVSYKVKYSTNWVGSQRGYNPHEIIVLTNENGAWDGPAWTALSLYIEHFNTGAGNVPRVGISDRQNIDQNNINVDLTGVSESRGVAGCNGNSDGYSTSCWDSGVNGNYWNEKTWDATQPYFVDQAGPYYKNDWHHVEVYVQLNSIVNGVAQTDGVVQYWFDGENVLNITDAMLRPGSRPNMRFNQFLLTGFFSDGSPITQSAWYDDLLLATTRPGSSSGCVDGQTRSCAGNSVGVCTPGVETCSGGSWNGVCAGQVLPGSEGSSCNSLDDDCDGSVDEELMCGGSGPVAEFTSTFQGSDWTDNGKWQLYDGWENYLQIFDTSLDPDVPGGRGLRLIGSNRDLFWSEVGIANAYLPPMPAVGESITWRHFHKIMSGGPQYHPHGYGNQVDWGATGVATFAFSEGPGNIWQPQIDVGQGQSPYATSDYVLEEDRWYRWVTTFTRLPANQWNVKVRIYDAQTNQMVVGPQDWLGNFGSSSQAVTTVNINQADNSPVRWNGFGSGVQSTQGNPHEQDRWAAVVAVAGDHDDLPFPVTGE